MKKFILLLTCIFIFGVTIYAQENIKVTETLYIEGKVKNPGKITLSEIEKLEEEKIKDVVIYNHKGEIKDTLFNMEGVPIKSILSKFEFAYENPKELNEFYFVFKASDGYKVVFSWNEIYNTEMGNSFYIITELKNQKLSSIKQRMMFLSPKDLKSGRRYIKGLERIEVRKLD
jgi:hypothetical protein